MPHDKMTPDQLIGKHGRLRQELAAAYADPRGPARHRGRVERLLIELRDIERKLGMAEPDQAAAGSEIPRAA